MERNTTQARPESLDDLLEPELVARLSSLDITSRKVLSGKLKGERRSKKKGESVEFADHRPYVRGDDPRFIDWNIFGRLDRLFLKLFMEEEDISVHIVLDRSASMGCGEPEKFFLAQQLAGAIGFVGLLNLHRVTLNAIGGEDDDDPDATGIKTLRNLRGRRRASEMGRWIASLTPEGESRFDDGARRIALTRTGKGVMIVLSDFFMKEGYEQGLRTLVGRGYDLMCVQILSPQEIDPSLGGDLRLRDIEDGDVAEVTISAPLLRRYKANLSSYCDALRTFCARRDISLMSVSSDTSASTIMLEYLRSRGVLR
ncbi:MAG: DUF58 domain-containing protein [Phycisphaerales bacterium JB043]